MTGEHSGAPAGDGLHAAASRLRAAAIGVGAAGSALHTEAAGALGGDAWLGSAARAAHRARSRAATVTDQVAGQLRRAALTLDSLGTALAEAECTRGRLLAEAGRLGWRQWGDLLVPVDGGTVSVLGRWLPAAWAAVPSAERDADAAAAAALRGVTAELSRLRLTASQPVAALIGSSQVMTLRRAGLLPAPARAAVGVQEAATDIRSLLRGRDPVAIRAYIESLPVGIRLALVERYPPLIGSGDGVPPAMRYAANRLVMARAHEQARHDGETALARRLAGWLSPGRQFLLVDLVGGRVAEVLGGLDTAGHVAVLVPGMLSSLANFDSVLAANARRLREQASRSAPGQVATIAWLGYRTPGLANAPFDNAATRRRRPAERAGGRPGAASDGDHHRCRTQLRVTGHGSRAEPGPAGRRGRRAGQRRPRHPHR